MKYLLRIDVKTVVKDYTLEVRGDYVEFSAED